MNGWVAPLIVLLTVHALVGRAQSDSSGPREDTLKRARVWMQPSGPVEAAPLDRTPQGPAALRPEATVSCRFKPERVGGTTPKFNCELADGERVRVKYGRHNPEIYTEVIASRLLNALGFPADYMYVVAKVRCVGCPDRPFEKLKCLAAGSADASCLGALNFNTSLEFKDAVIERQREGRRVETETTKGWSYHELEKIDHAAGGSSRAEVDALRLMAVFLAHWDNKSENQRLVCLDEGQGSPGPCRTPVAMNQDLGGTFGPRKFDLNGWQASPIWTDRARCVVSMGHLPYQGATFKDVQISEDGRLFLSGLLRKLSPAQIRGLFVGARIDRSPNPTTRDADAWVRVFQEKVRKIAEGSACPAVASATAKDR